MNKTSFANLIILVHWEESKPKIIDNWYTDIGLISIQLLDILTKLNYYPKLLTLSVNK